MPSRRIVNIASKYGNVKLDFDDLQTATGKYSFLRATGKLWASRKMLPTPGMGSDPAARQRLWDACAKLAGLG